MKRYCITTVERKPLVISAKEAALLPDAVACKTGRGGEGSSAQVEEGAGGGEGAKVPRPEKDMLFRRRVMLSSRKTLDTSAGEK